ncbi:MAG TPA: hypothetical protein V6C58_03425 [Allocoleopsis sp.]
MALLGTITKQSREVGDSDISYTNYLAQRPALVDIQSHVTEVSPAGLTISSNLYDNNKVKIIFSNGTNGVTYKVTVLATTSEGLVLEDEIHIAIKDI